MTPQVLTMLIAGLIGLGTFFVGIIIANWLTASTDRVADEFDAQSDTRDQTARFIRSIGTSFSELGRPFPGLSEWLDQQLTYAGRPYGGVNGQQYLAAVIVLSFAIAMTLGAFFFATSVMGGNDVGTAFGSGLRWFLVTIIGVGGFLIQDVRANASRHSDEIEREFPFFLDLAVLVVQAGGTPRKSLAKYVEASPGTALSREIAITAKEADSTSFEGALFSMIDRVQPTSVKTILKNLAQGERSSGEAEQFYTDQAEELRFLREEMANRTAERLKTNIIFPVFLMMSGIILAALAPTIVSIRGQGFF